MSVVYRELTPNDWKLVTDLFGANGACGGCWCMWWRREKGEDWDALKGARNRRRFKRLVEGGEANGILALDTGVPAGWCAFGPRLDFPALERARTLKCDDAERVWSITCLFVLRGYRRKGIASGMVAAAVAAMQRRDAEVIEAYPVRPPKGKPMPDAFAYTGLPSTFRKLGFRHVGRRDQSRQRMRFTGSAAR
jgi:GNAT superfamily N-acetyltransferase